MSVEQNDPPPSSMDPSRTSTLKGYKPMQGGYQPSGERGYTASGEVNGSPRPDTSSLPKPPKGGTGESNGTASTNSSE